MVPKSVLITVKSADGWMLLRVSVIAMSKKRAKRLAAGEPPAKAAPGYVGLEMKTCEICGKPFLRPIGSDVKHCAERHSAPVRPGDLQRLEAALLEGREAERRRKGGRIRVAARG